MPYKNEFSTLKPKAGISLTVFDVRNTLHQHMELHIEAVDAAKVRTTVKWLVVIISTQD